MMNQGISIALGSAAIKAMATRLRDSTYRSQRHNRDLVRQVRDHVDKDAQLSAKRLGFSSMLAILGALVLDGTSGFIWAAAAQIQLAAGLLVILMPFGVSLLDEAWLMLHRADVLKGGRAPHSNKPTRPNASRVCFRTNRGREASISQCLKTFKPPHANALSAESWPAGAANAPSASPKRGTSSGSAAPSCR